MAHQGGVCVHVPDVAKGAGPAPEERSEEGAQAADGGPVRHAAQASAGRGGRPVDTAVDTGAADANGVVVDWLWAFNGEDAKDTKLGNATTKATIDFTLTVTVEQVEKVA